MLLEMRLIQMFSAISMFSGNDLIYLNVALMYVIAHICPWWLSHILKNASFIYLYNIVYASQYNTIFKCFTFYASQQSTLFTYTKYNVPIKQHTEINYSVV